jgi:glycosyltransferase involved in cell wall biosynthesis
MAKQLEIKVIYSLHDFYTVCPSVNLIDNDAIYFPEGVKVNAANPLWNDDTCLPSTPESLNLWKKRMNESLSYADLYITTNQSGKEILMSNLDVLKDRESDFHVVAHGRDFESFHMLPLKNDITETNILNILLPGNIGHSKGARLIKEIKLQDTDNKFVFHVLGKCVKDLKGYVVDHGEYKREEFASKVEQINPDITAIFSIWPETYCHTLTESWANGLPVIAVDLGAVGDRISRRGGGWLIGPDTTEIMSKLEEILGDVDMIATQKKAVEDWQKTYGKENSVSKMSNSYLDMYKKFLK